MNSDLVVVLPGIMGSTLLDAGGHPIWAPSGGALLRAIASFGRSIKSAELPDGIGDQHPGDGITPGQLMPDLHALPGIWTPVKGYDPLINKRLASMGYHTAGDQPGAPPGNLLPVPYDWRLSNRYNGQRLAGIVEPALERWRAQGGAFADAQLVFVCHSMGGLVARWYIEKCGGAEITRKLITLGTPYRGAAKALDQLINGIRKGLGKLALDLTDFSRSLPSLYQLIPDYACLEHSDDWVTTTEYPERAGKSLPELSTPMLDDAARFHADLAAAEAARPDSLDMTHMVIGVRQPTGSTVRIHTDGHAELLDTFGSDNDYGDATVPLTGAVGHGLTYDSNRIRRIPDQHGDLQRNKAALDELQEAITAEPVRRRAGASVPLRVTAPELLIAGEPMNVEATVDDDSRHAVQISITDEHGRRQVRTPRVQAGNVVTTFADLAPGAYTIDVAGLNASSPLAPVSSDVIVWDPAEGD